MATRRTKPEPVKFPFNGSDAENLVAARRMAKTGLKKKAYKSKSVLPKALVSAVLNASYPTKRDYLDAYVQELATKELDGPRDGHSGDRSLSDDDKYDYSKIRHHVGMHLDCGPEALWDTKMGRLKATSEVDKWEPIPDGIIDEIKNRRIPQAEWENWATRFLLFASEYSQLLAAGKGLKGGIAKAEGLRSKPVSLRRGK
jgi:hypothetical protein